MSQHSKIGPSKAKQWTECTASVSFIEQNERRLPPERGSSYADEGTTAHRYGEEVLKGELTLDQVPDDFRPHVALYVQTCRELIPTDGSWHVVHIEEEVPLFYKPQDIGTVDFLVATKDAIHVRDLKYGAGVLVQSEHNKQLAIYAWSAIRPLLDNDLFPWPPDTVVTIHAIQPRHHEWVNTPWVLTLGELQDFIEAEIAPKAKIILEGGETEFSPGEETCRWCRAKAICPARAAALTAIPCDVFTDLDAELPPPEALSDEQLLAVFRNSKQIGAFLGDVANHLTAMALTGNPLPGTKLVQGREGNRKWGDEQVAAAALESAGLDPWKASVISPADAEKKLKAEKVQLDLSPFITRSPGQPVLALESDKRPALDAAVEAFANLGDGEE